MWDHREQLTFGAAAVLVAIGFFSIPSWEGALFSVCHYAAVSGVLTLVIFAYARRLGARGAAVERATSAIFLAGMPGVYVVAWLASSGAGTGDGRLLVELSGLLVYGGLAWLGFRRSPWFLVVGVAMHGVGWDAWHHLAASGYVPNWYVNACLMADVGIAAYLATRVPAWPHARSPAARRRASAEDVATSAMRSIRSHGGHIGGR